MVKKEELIVSLIWVRLVIDALCMACIRCFASSIVAATCIHTHFGVSHPLPTSSVCSSKGIEMRPFTAKALSLTLRPLRIFFLKRTEGVAHEIRSRWPKLPKPPHESILHIDQQRWSSCNILLSSPECRHMEVMGRQSDHIQYFYGRRSAERHSPLHGTVLLYPIFG